MTDKNYAVFAIIEGVPGQNGKIPLIQDKYKPPPRLWKLPGGKTEFDERPEFALMREIFEEVKINIMPPDDKNMILKKDCSNHIFIVYKVKYYNGDISIGKEIEYLKFFTTREINMMLNDRQILPKHAEALMVYLYPGKTYPYPDYPI